MIITHRAFAYLRLGKLLKAGEDLQYVNNELVRDHLLLTFLQGIFFFKLGNFPSAYFLIDKSITRLAVNFPELKTSFFNIAKIFLKKLKRQMKS